MGRRSKRLLASLRCPGRALTKYRLRRRGNRDADGEREAEQNGRRPRRSPRCGIEGASTSTALAPSDVPRLPSPSASARQPSATEAYHPPRSRTRVAATQIWTRSPASGRVLAPEGQTQLARSVCEPHGVAPWTSSCIRRAAAASRVLGSCIFSSVSNLRLAANGGRCQALPFCFQTSSYHHGLSSFELGVGMSKGSTPSACRHDSRSGCSQVLFLGFCKRRAAAGPVDALNIASIAAALRTS